MPDPSFGDPNSAQDPSQSAQQDPQQILQAMAAMGIMPQGGQGQMPPQGMPQGQSGMSSMQVPPGMIGPGYNPQMGATNALAPGAQSLANVNPKQRNALQDPKTYLQAITNPMGFITQLAAHGLKHLISSIGKNKQNPLADLPKQASTSDNSNSDNSGDGDFGGET